MAISISIDESHSRLNEIDTEENLYEINQTRQNRVRLRSGA